VVTGGFSSGSLDFGEGSIETSAYAAIFLAQFSADGTNLSLEGFDATGGGDAFGTAIASSGDRIFIAGYFQESLNIGAAQVTTGDSGADFLAALP
jgi:hypothetical protein